MRRQSLAATANSPAQKPFQFHIGKKSWARKPGTPLPTISAIGQRFFWVFLPMTVTSLIIAFVEMRIKPLIPSGLPACSCRFTGPHNNQNHRREFQIDPVQGQFLLDAITKKDLLLKLLTLSLILLMIPANLTSLIWEFPLRASQKIHSFSIAHPRIHSQTIKIISIKHLCDPQRMISDDFLKTLAAPHPDRPRLKQ